MNKFEQLTKLIKDLLTQIHFAKTKINEYGKIIESDIFEIRDNEKWSAQCKVQKTEKGEKNEQTKN